MCLLCVFSQIPLIIGSCIILAFVIALILLFPSTPSITTQYVGLHNLVWVMTDTGGLSANLTVAASLILENHNRYGASYEETPIDFSLRREGRGMEHLASLTLPSGYIGAKSESEVNVAADLYNVELANVVELASLARRMEVWAGCKTKGHVRILGIRIPWTVSTSCSITCSLNLWTLEVTLLEQECSTHMAT